MHEALVRIDDFPWVRETYNAGEVMDTLPRMLAPLNARGIPFILGVSPAYLSYRWGAWLRSIPLPHGRAVLHGWDHMMPTIEQRVREPNGYRALCDAGGEFAGIRAVTALHLLTRGIRVMLEMLGEDACDISQYIAPFNCYTAQTVLALEDLGVATLHTCDVEFERYAYASIPLARARWQVARFQVDYDDVHKVLSRLRAGTITPPVTLHWVFDVKHPHWEVHYQQLAEELAERGNKKRS